MILTKGAMLMAHVYHNVYQKSESDNLGFPVGGWGTLSRHDRMVMGTAFQTLFDLGVMKPFTLVEVRKLVSAGIMDEPYERSW